MYNNETKGAGALVLCSFLYSLYAIYSRLMGNAFAPFYQAWIRIIPNLVILFALILVFKKWKPLRKKDIAWLICIGVCSSLVDVLYYIAVIKISIGTTLFLFYATSTVFSYFWGSFFFREKITRVKQLSVLLAVAGTFFLYLNQISLTSRNLGYLFVASLAGVGVSVFNTFNKKVSDRYSSFQIAAVSNMVGFPIVFLSSLFLRESWYLNLISVPWLVNIIFSATQVVINVLIVYGFKHIEVQKGSLILLFELICGVVLGILLYHEIPNAVMVLGGVFILTALSLPLINYSRRQNAGQ